jgi:hypothetical protein
MLSLPGERLRLQQPADLRLQNGVILREPEERCRECLLRQHLLALLLRVELGQRLDVRDPKRDVLAVPVPHRLLDGVFGASAWPALYITGPTPSMSYSSDPSRT